LASPIENEILYERKPTLDWAPVTGVESYSLQVSTTSNFSTIMVVDVTVNAPTTQYTIPFNLASNRRYYWRVRSNGPSYGPSVWSESGRFREAMIEPYKMRPLNNATLTDRTPLFTWETRSPEAEFYRIQISRFSDFSTILRQAQIREREYTSPSLPAGITLYWRVRAEGGGIGPSQWSVVLKFIIK
jgi:hypothetical protein